MEFNIFQLFNSCCFFKPPQDVTLLLCCFAKSYLHSCILNQNNQALEDWVTSERYFILSFGLISEMRLVNSN